MKTILYQPLFINPQAYFVFPQLYHIEKGDSYIEPANITGQLIINDLTKVLTSTPTLNVVQDTNQVDFGLFKGKHIRISQYTNIGAVVLGEWYIPGIPIPPEPEQPDWFKESIVAWYSPYCKQGMTNYDVIEAYTEDFTTWTVNKKGVIANVTSKSITITNVLNSNPLIYAYDTFSVRLRIDGLKNGQGIFFGDNKEYTISENGIYDIDTTENIRTNFIGECNITITQLPTSILKDFSGNGNHAYLYGGKGKLDSGMGVYKFDFLSDLRINSAYIPYSDRQEDKICSLIEHPAGWLFQFVSLSDIPAFKVEVKGIVNDRFVYRYYDENGNRGKEIIINKDGIYELPISYSVENNTGVGIICSDACVDNVCFTQIPDYPDQLCYDGKMYAVCYGFPILTDYTVMAERTWFEKEEYSAFISNSLGGMEEPGNGAFSVELKSLNSFTTISFGSITSIGIPEKGITYQTKQSYNGNSINVGTKESNDILILGGRYFYKNGNVAGNTWTGCHGNILIFNRTLTEYELSWVKNNMMCSKPQEPDIDL